MKQIYIACSFALRNELKEEITLIKKEISAQDITPFVFIEHYSFTAEQEKEMMQKAFENISTSFCLFAETTDKGIGIGIEAGYAKALGKPVIYLRKKEAEHSTTLSGMADFCIIYSDKEDLKNQVKNILIKLKERIL